MAAQHPAARRPAILATAIALPVALAVGVVVAAVLAQRSPVLEPVAVSAIDAPDADGPACSALLAALPAELGGAGRAELAEPAPAGVAAWRSAESGTATPEPYVLRCGLSQPVELTNAASLVAIDDVQLLEISGAAAGVQASTWVVVDREVYLAITLPTGSGPAPLQDLSAAVSATLTAQEPSLRDVTGG